MTPRLMGCVAVAGLLLVGCGTEQQAETETAPAVAEADALPPAVARAVAVARGIAANPAAADSILAAHGLTAAGLDSLMYTIAEDSALAAAYNNAMR
jgi:hypothetical protein